MRIGWKILRGFDDEGLCERCGLCCHLSLRLGKMNVVFEELPCRFLDKTGCRIYERRLRTGFCFEVNRKNVERGLYPESCVYVRGLVGYRGKRLLAGKEAERARREAERRYRRSDKPPSIRAEDWNRFFKRGSGEEGE